MTDFEESVRKLKIIISEVDGVLAADDRRIDELGNVPFKTFSKKDFEAINELKKYFKVVFVSNDNAVSYNHLRRKNIPFYYDPKDKSQAVKQILSRYEVGPEEAMYVAYSYSDLKCMQLIPFSVCPPDAVREVVERATKQLDMFGGVGFFCDLYDFLKPEIRRRIAQDV